MEKVCLELVNIEVSFLDRLVLDIPRLAIHQFDRIGIVGKNGAGKSTLLKLIGGMLIPDKGQVNSFVEFAYLDQVTPPLDAIPDFELAAKLAVPKHQVQNFSGGEQTRLKLAQLFSNYHEGLLLDEPTTHLDAAGTEFFIQELTYYYGALVMVSHDRHVLDQLVTKIWEVEGGCITEYTGNYSEYIAQKELEEKQQLEQHDKYEKEKNRLLNAADEKMKKASKITQSNKRISKAETKAKTNRMFMTKSKGTSQKAVQRAAKAIEQRVEQLEVVDAPDKERTIYFHQAPALNLHNKFPIIAQDLTLRAGDKLLLDQASFQFPLGDTVAITGNNGSGKSTLLRHIQQQGQGVTMSPKVVIGAYEQRGYYFNSDKTVLAYMEENSDYPQNKIRAALNAMKFTGNDLNKDVRSLSGGEAIRLVLCQLFLGRFNILFLDEPTTFLDIFCIQALERFVKAYQGTVVLVSHDQVFLDNVADTVYKIEDLQLKVIS